MTGIKSSIYKISFILIGIIILPALFYSLYEITALTKNEKMIARIYEQQLDAILFSVNQYLWDNLTAWQSRIKRIESQANRTESPEEYRRMIEDIPALEMVAFSDTLFTRWQIFIKPGAANKENYLRQVLVDSMTKNAELITRLNRYSRAKYSKIETLKFTGPDSTGAEKLILFYLSDSREFDKRVVYFQIDINSFINTILGPKLEDIAGQQFIVAVFSTNPELLLYQNALVQITELKQTRALWVFPNYRLGIRLRGESIEDLVRNRFYTNMLLILGVDIILLLGAWIVFTMIRQQMRLAQMKSDFVSNVSHELRTPLALIRMYAETLELGRLRDEKKQQEYYRIIGQETERLTRLINNILNFSRIESGKKQYHFKEVDLNLLINNLIEMYDYHIQNSGFKLNLALDSTIPRIQGDEEAITEALLNLLDNAIKYSEKEKYIAIRSLRQNGDVRIEIEDHGIGIEAGQAKYIFEKFYRASGSLVHNTKGSGLGLTLVKHIMEAHHGRVELVSTPGKGSCFSLIFASHNLIDHR